MTQQRSKLEGIKPNQQTQAILDWLVRGRGHAIVKAYAGTGKTTALLFLVRDIIRHNLGNVFLGAFNKPIATVLQEELKLLDIHWKEGEASTIHSAGLRLCRRAWRGVVVEERKTDRFITALCSQLAERNASTIKHGVSLAKQTGIGITHPIQDLRVWEEMFDHYGLNDIYEGDSLEAIIRMCMVVLEASNDSAHISLDYDDMVYTPLVFRLRVLYPYDWVLGDEVQDWNVTRTMLAFRLLSPNGRMIAVGDEHQSIYGFSGAQHDAMEKIAERMGKHSTFPLSVTYRCPKLVVQEAQAYVSDFEAHSSARDGVVKRMTLQAPELKIDQIARLPSTVFRFCEFEPTDAVLCRNIKPLVELAYTLIRAKISCRVEGRDIGIGLKRIAGRWKVKSLDTLRDKLDKYLAKEVKKWKDKNREEEASQIEDKVQTLLVLIECCRKENKHTLLDLHNLIDLMFDDTPTGSDSGKDTKERKLPRLTLSTAHKAKGREWDRVFILDKEKYMPSSWARKDWELQQESNLVYVAITRAKDTLVYLTTTGR